MAARRDRASTDRVQPIDPRPPRQVLARSEETELQVEELEERIAPRLASNHNETFLMAH